MSGSIPLFEINPDLDRHTLAAQFARDRRVQIRNVLTDRTAREIHKILSQYTSWGFSWKAGDEGPQHIRRQAMARKTPQQLADMAGKLKASMKGSEYAFVYSAYPMVEALLEHWDPGHPLELLLDHINSEPFLGLVRQVTGIPELLRADAQATLFAPGNFLAQHNDGHVADGWRIAYVLNFTADEWRPDWGGYLLFFDEDGDVVTGFKPRFNALNLFAVPQSHAVTFVPDFSPVGRYAITGWLRDR